MHPTANRILQLTLAVAQASAEGDLTRCDELLTERGEAVRCLSDLHAAAGGGEPPAEVRETLKRVRQLDAELERSWNEQKDQTGRELSRVAGRPKQKHGTEAPCILNRQA